MSVVEAQFPFAWDDEGTNVEITAIPSSRRYINMSGEPIVFSVVDSSQRFYMRSRQNRIPYVNEDGSVENIEVMVAALNESSLNHIIVSPTVALQMRRRRWRRPLWWRVLYLQNAHHGLYRLMQYNDKPFYNQHLDYLVFHVLSESEMSTLSHQDYANSI